MLRIRFFFTVALLLGLYINVFFFQSVSVNTIAEKSKLSSPVSVRFFGDVMLGRHVETLIRQNGNDYLLAQFDELSTVDAVVINFESAMIIPHRQTPNFTFQFATLPSNISTLDRLGVTHASLANNHAYDYGVLGFDITSNALRELDIAPFGHPSIVSTSTSVTFIENDLSTIALIGIHTLFRIPTREDLETVFAYARERSEQQIVYVHWGDEYALRANTTQRALAAQFVELGADLVVGHHPHVVQDVEVIGGVPIFYSLGNFIFDQYFSEGVMDGLVIDAIFQDGLVVTLHPVTSRDKQSQPRRMSDDESQAFLGSLAQRSDPALFAMIIDGSIDVEKLAIGP